MEEKACKDLSTAVLSFVMAEGPEKEESYKAWMTLWCQIEKDFKLLGYNLSKIQFYKPGPEVESEADTHMIASTQTDFATTHRERNLTLKNDRLRYKIDILEQIIDYKD